MVQDDLKKLVKARLQHPGQTSSEVFDYVILPATREGLVMLADFIAKSNKAATLRKEFTATTNAAGIASFADANFLVWTLDTNKVLVNDEIADPVADPADMQSTFVSSLWYYFLEDNIVTVRGKTPGSGLTGLVIKLRANYVPDLATLPRELETDLVNIVVSIIESTPINNNKEK